MTAWGLKRPPNEEEEEEGLSSNEDPKDSRQKGEEAVLSLFVSFGTCHFRTALSTEEEGHYSPGTTS